MPTGKALTFVEQARRAQIIGVTLDVVARHGFAKASLARIAEAAGLTKAAVLYHFPSKDAILRAAYATVIEGLVDEVGGAVDARSGAAALNAYVSTFVAHLTSHPTHVRMLVEAGGADDTSRDTGRRDNVAALVESAVAAGDYRGDVDPLVTAVLVNGAVDAIVAEFVADPQFDAAAAAGALTDLLDRSLRAE